MKMGALLARNCVRFYRGNSNISGNYFGGVEDKVDYIRLGNLKLSSPFTGNILSEMFSSRVLL